MSPYAKTRAAIRGPVAPIPTPFKPGDHAVDHAALERYVDWLVGQGVPVILTTVGTSRFNLLTTEEMLAVNETVARTVGDRALSIVAGPLDGSTRENVRFAQHAAKVGAGAFIAMFPERFYGEEPIYEFFKTVSEEAGIGVMIHEMAMRNGLAGGPVQYSLELLDRLTDLPGIVGMKEECCDAEYSYRIIRRVSHKTGLIGWGSMRRFLRDHHAGSRAALMSIGNFLPKIELAMHAAVAERRYDEAERLVREYEDDFFALAVQLGWHRALKETIHQFGLLPRGERPPFGDLTAEQCAQIAAFIAARAWRPKE
jgi:4-hydroxy-tetrahydrodipicolinate synthase